MIDSAELLKELVRVNTTNPPGGEQALLERLERRLKEAGVPSVFQQTAPGRGNLLSCLPATRPSGQPALFLLSHVDVVGADPAQWEHDPFGAQEDEAGYIHGRGTVDTKQLTAMELCAFLSLAEQGIPRTRDVYFLATSDEECGSALGLGYFLEHEITLEGKTATGAQLLRGSDVISEGGGFPVWAGDKLYYLCESGQKGCATVEFTVKARKAKGPFFGSGDGMVRAMALAEDIGKLRLEQRLLDTVRRFEDRLGGAPLSGMMGRILTAMKRSTITVTMISGRNVNEVRLTCDVRLLPGLTEEYLRGVLDGLARKWDCGYRILSLSQGYESSPDSRFLGLLEQATQQALGQTRAELVSFVSMGSSDGRFLAPLGAHVYGYSPVYPWDMTFDTAVTMVHGINERIHKDSVRFGTRVLTLAVQNAVREELST